jgi:hypothetical protein
VPYRIGIILGYVALSAVLVWWGNSFSAESIWLNILLKNLLVVPFMGAVLIVEWQNLKTLKIFR